MKDEIKEILEDNDELMVRYKDNSFECFDTLPKNVLDYITNLQEEINRLIAESTEWENRTYYWQDKAEVLQEENKRLLKIKKYAEDVGNKRNELYERIDKAIEYITSYEAISTIQGLNKIEQNKKLDETTMNVMIERYLKVHHNLLNLLQGEGKE